VEFAIHPRSVYSIVGLVVFLGLHRPKGAFIGGRPIFLSVSIGYAGFAVILCQLVQRCSVLSAQLRARPSLYNRSRILGRRGCIPGGLSEAADFPARLDPTVKYASLPKTHRGQVVKGVLALTFTFLRQFPCLEQTAR